MVVGLLDLPLEVLEEIASEIDIQDLKNLCVLNNRAWTIFKSDVFWISKVYKEPYLKNSHWRSYMSLDELQEYKVSGRPVIDYCNKKLKRRTKVAKVIDDLSSWKRHENTNEKQLETDINELLGDEECIPFVYLEIRRLSTDNRFLSDPYAYVNIEDFKNSMKDRLDNLPKVHFASILLEMFSKNLWIDNYKKLINASDDYVENLQLEEVYVISSIMDPLFYDLLQIRNTVTKSVLKEFNKEVSNLQVLLNNVEKIKLLMKVFDAETTKWSKYNGFPRLAFENFERSYVLRIYAGLASPTPMVYNSIILRFCKLLNISHVVMNELSIGVEIYNEQEKESQMYYIVHTIRGISVFDREESDIFGNYPIFHDMFIQLQKHENNKKLINKHSWRRFVFMNIMESTLLLFYHNDSEVSYDSKNDIVGLKRNDLMYGQCLSLGKSINNNLKYKLIYDCFNSRRRFNPVIPSSIDCLKLFEWINYDPFHQIYEFDDYKLAVRSQNGSLLSEFKRHYNDYFNYNIKLKPLELEFKFESGDIVKSNSQKNLSIIIAIMVPFDFEITELDEDNRDSIIRENGYALLYNNNAIYLSDLWGYDKVDIKSYREFDFYALALYDNLGEWFERFDIESGKFIRY